MVIVSHNIVLILNTISVVIVIALIVVICGDRVVAGRILSFLSRRINCCGWRIDVRVGVNILLMIFRQTRRRTRRLAQIVVRSHVGLLIAGHTTSTTGHNSTRDILVGSSMTMMIMMMMMVMISPMLVVATASMQRVARSDAALANAKLGRLEDLPVDDAHDDERQVEGTESRDELIGEIVRELTPLLGHLFGHVAEAEYVRRDGYERGHCPYDDDHRGDSFGCAFRAIVNVRDRPVAIERDRHQVEDACRAAKNVKTRPYVAHDSTQVPFLRREK